MKVVCLLNLFYLLFQGYKFTNIPDPCGADLLGKEHVVTMCEEGTALEESVSGLSTVDSVVVRIDRQLEGCTCSVRLLSDTGNSSLVYVRAYSLLSSAAPASQSCGLHVQIETTSTNIPYSHIIKCNEALTTQTVQVSRDETLEIMLKLADGSFDHGYCLQIYRMQSENPHTLKIQCFGPPTNETTSTSNSLQNDNSTCYMYTVISACVAAFMSILAIILCILLLKRQIEERRKLERTNSHSNYEIPSCRREPSDYSDLHQI